MSARRPPSFLVFVCDQLRADHLGCYGNPHVRTPAIDGLAQASAVFERAHVANPVCMPNRATIATGRWPSVHGTRTNGVTLDPEAATFMRSLRGAGWDTVAVGKLHFQTMGWPFEPEQLDEMRKAVPLLLDGATADAAARPRPAGWDRFELDGRHRAGWVDMPGDYYGFDHVDLVVGHADRATGHYTHWARERGVDPEQLSGYARASRRYAGWDQVYRTEVPVEAYPTTYVTERVLHHLERLAGSERPFLVFCSFPDPHHPFSPPGRYWDMYAPEAMTPPPTFGDAHAGSPPHVRAIAARRGLPASDPTMTWAPSEDQLRHAMAAELGMVGLIDDGVGRILRGLRDLGLDEGTVVLFTSDHGDLFGDHGLLLKHFVHYEGALRVPLILRVPEGEAGRRDALACSADIAPTILDLAGVTPYRGIQGHSLRPLLERRAAAVRERLLVEEDQPFGIDGLSGPVRMRTLICDEARMTVYERRPFGELYDRTADPDELVNVYDDSDHAALRARMAEALAQELMALADTGVAPVAAA